MLVPAVPLRRSVHVIRTISFCWLSWSYGRKSESSCPCVMWGALGENPCMACEKSTGISSPLRKGEDERLPCVRDCFCRRLRSSAARPLRSHRISVPCRVRGVSRLSSRNAWCCASSFLPKYSQYVRRSAGILTPPQAASGQPHPHEVEAPGFHPAPWRVLWRTPILRFLRSQAR